MPTRLTPLIKWNIATTKRSGQANWGCVLTSQGVDHLWPSLRVHARLLPKAVLVQWLLAFSICAKLSNAPLWPTNICNVCVKLQRKKFPCRRQYLYSLGIYFPTTLLVKRLTDDIII